jgi:hypothetical protein
MRGEILGRAHNGRPVIGRDADGDHVSLDVFADLNPGIETRRHELNPAVVGGDVEQNLWILAGEPGQLDRKLGPSCEPWNKHADASDRPVLQTRHFVERFSDVSKRWSQPCDQSFASLGGRNAPRGARQQAHTDPLFQPADRMAHR